MQLAYKKHQPVQFLIGQRFQRRTKNGAPKVAHKFVLARPPMEFFSPCNDLILRLTQVRFGLDLFIRALKGLEDIGASGLMRWS